MRAKRLGVPGILAAAFLLVGTTPPRVGLRLVSEGSAKAVVLVPDPPSSEAETAAQVLRDHVQQMSGAELTIRKESDEADPATEDRPWILVGEGRRARELGFSTRPLGPGGILLQAKGPVLVLLGKDSSLAAVTAFLEDKLGVRYLWPGELGKVVPRRTTLEIAAFEHSYSPKLVERRIRVMDYHDRIQEGLDQMGFRREDYARQLSEAARTTAKTPDWGAWHRLGGSIAVMGGHAFDGYWDKYGKDHPEWFALQPNGSRDQSASRSRPRLCKSNPELVATVARNTIDVFNKNPALLGVTIAPSDGGRTCFCLCASCEALDAPEGRKVKWGSLEHVSYTDRVVTFWNAIAEQVTKVHPDKYLVVDVYSVYSAPPIRSKLHPRLLLRYTDIGGYYDEERRKQQLQDFRTWTQGSPRFYFRPNLMLEGRRTGFPLLYVHTFAQDFRTIVDGGAMGTDFDAICGHWATQGLNYYVVARLNWNAHQDVDEIIDDYCRAGFGPAATSVRRYFDVLESARRAALENKVPQNQVFTAQVLADLRKPLEQARKDVGDDKPCGDRLAFLELGLRWTELEGRAFAVQADRKSVDPETAKKLFEERSRLMKDIFQKSPLAVNVAYAAWGDGLGK